MSTTEQPIKKMPLLMLHTIYVTNCKEIEILVEKNVQKKRKSAILIYLVMIYGLCIPPFTKKPGKATALHTLHTYTRKFSHLLCTSEIRMCPEMLWSSGLHYIITSYLFKSLTNYIILHNINMYLLTYLLS